MFEQTVTDLQQPSAIGVIPTDTVYGVVARASDQAAVARLYAVKNRTNKPGTLIAASIEQFVALGIERRYLKAVEQFWPGPVSVILPAGEDLAYLHAYKGTLAVRVPDDDDLIGLLEQVGPLLTSSANQPGEPPAVSVNEARNYFGDEVDFYVDGGDLSGRKPSTVVRIIDDEIEVVREGAVKINESGEVEK